MKLHPCLKKTLIACALAATLTTALPLAQAAEYNYTADNVSMWESTLWHDPDADGNTVTVTGVTAEDADLRAANATSRDNTATNYNTATITDSTLKSVAGAYNTGSSTVASATNNVVSLSGSTVQGKSYIDPEPGMEEEVSSYVYGARTDAGDATQNLVTISNSTVEGELAGAKAEGRGNSTDNSLTITAGTTVSEDNTMTTLYGGYSYSGKAESNSVTIGGASTVDGTVHGGYTHNGGDATSNTVTIQEGAKAGEAYIYGGHTYNGGEVTDNSVIITNATAGDVYGGRAEEGGTASGNSVELRTDATGTTQAYAYTVTGGYSYRYDAEKNTVTLENASVHSDVWGGYSYYADATDNTVTIRDKASTGMVYGGSSYAGSASGNTVVVEGSEVSFVYGGSSDNGAATNNHVTLDNTTFGAYVYGGEAGSGADASGNTITLNNAKTSNNGTGYIYGGKTSGKGNATNNTVTLKGEANELTKVTIYGGYSGSGDDVTGNTLTLEGFKGTLKGIRNFEIVNFVLSSWEDGATLLTLTDGASILNNFTLNIDLAGWNAEVEAEGQMTLIAGLNAESLLADWTLSVDGTSPFSLDSPFDVKLVSREDGSMDLVAFTPGYDPEGTTAAVPEPTTATLSLLALAGLAARRRRK